MKKMTDKVKQEIFSKTFNHLSLAMLNVMEDFEKHDQWEVLEESSFALLMFCVHTSVKMGMSEPDLHETINDMVSAVHLKMKSQGVYYDS